MEGERKDIIKRFLQNQVAQADNRALGYVLDEKGNKNPTRNAYVKLNMHLTNFMEGKTSVRWIVMHGLRGAGKTTLVSQLYHNSKRLDRNINRIFLAVDEINRVLGFSLKETMEVYEELLGTVFERLDKPLLLFLDEVQYDKDWAIVLKTIYDRTNKVFIISTGSSALTLQTNSDVARRAYFERLLPMSFTEYNKVKNHKYEIAGLCEKLRTALYSSNNATEVFSQLKLLEKDVDKYWMGIDRLEFKKYIRWGTLPYMVKIDNESIAYDLLKKTVDRIIAVDVPELGKFETDVIKRIPEILYMVAGSDTVSVTRMSSNLGINKLTLSEVLEVLEKTETLIRVFPYGSPGIQVRKPSKYLFLSSAIRSMYFNFTSSVIDETLIKGKLLEDTIGLYLTKYMQKNIGTSLTYDNSEKGADFFLKTNGGYIIIEVGSGKKGFQQINNSFNKIGAKYGLVISANELALDGQCRSVYIPLKYFLLS